MGNSNGDFSLDIPEDKTLVLLTDFPWCVPQQMLWGYIAQKNGLQYQERNTECSVSSCVLYYLNTSQCLSFHPVFFQTWFQDC